MGAKLVPVIKTLSLDQPDGHPASPLVAQKPKQVSLALTDSNHRLLDNPC